MSIRRISYLDYQCVAFSLMCTDPLSFTLFSDRMFHPLFKSDFLISNINKFTEHNEKVFTPFRFNALYEYVCSKFTVAL